VSLLWFGYVKIKATIQRELLLFHPLEKKLSWEETAYNILYHPIPAYQCVQECPTVLQWFQIAMAQNSDYGHPIPKKALFVW